MSHQCGVQRVITACFYQIYFAAVGFFCRCTDYPNFAAVFVHGIFQRDGCGTGNPGNHVMTAGMSQTREGIIFCQITDFRAFLCSFIFCDICCLYICCACFNGESVFFQQCSLQLHSVEFLMTQFRVIMHVLNHCNDFRLYCFKSFFYC